MKIISFIIQYRHWFIGGLVALVLIFAAWRIQVHINGLKNQSFIKGYQSAEQKCELDKAAVIVKGKTSRERIDREIQKMPDADVIKFLRDNGFLRGE